MRRMSGLLDELLSAPPAVVYLLVGLLVFGEAAVFVGFVLPGETAVVLGGVLASRHAVELPVLIVLVAVCAIVGDSVGYEVGKHYGVRLLSLGPLRKHEERLDRARGFLRERGGSAVFLGRWTAFLRAVMPALAGMSKMHYPTFLVWNAAGGLAWGSVVVTAGYLAGRSYARVETWLGRGAAVAVGAVVVVALVVWQVRRHRAEGGQGAQGAEGADAEVGEKPSRMPSAG
jgi:membrane-associated protein